jgi:Zn-finger nucleic acid-binding protein
MNSPVFPGTPMQLREIEPGLSVYECPKSGGLWIPLSNYLAWKEKQPPVGEIADGPGTASRPEDSRPRALLCPESGRLMLRYRVGHGLGFHIQRSPSTGGVWLDKGQWEALKKRGLHVGLHLIVTAGYQRNIRSAAYGQKLTETFCERIGAADFTRVSEFGAWLAQHSRRRDILCYLLEKAEPQTESEAPPAMEGGDLKLVAALRKNAAT